MRGLLSRNSSASPMMTQLARSASHRNPTSALTSVLKSRALTGPTAPAPVRLAWYAEPEVEVALL